MNFWQKLLVILGVLFVFILAGSSVMLWVASLAGIDLETISNLSEAALDSGQVRQLKYAFGLNHFISFICSGLLLVLLFSKNKIADYTNYNKRIDGFLLLKFLGLLLLSYPIFSAIIGLTQLLPLPEWANSMDAQNMEALKSLLVMDSFFDFILNFIIIAIFAGVGEELIFRGIIQKELYKYCSPAMSIIIAAIIFGLFHFEITGLLPKILIGAILGFSYYITNNILYPVILHTVNNGAQVILLYAMGSELPAETDEPSLQALCFGLVFIIPVYWLAQGINEKHNANGQFT